VAESLRETTGFIILALAIIGFLLTTVLIVYRVRTDIYKGLKNLHNKSIESMAPFKEWKKIHNEIKEGTLTAKEAARRDEKVFQTIETEVYKEDIDDKPDKPLYRNIVTGLFVASTLLTILFFVSVIIEDKNNSKYFNNYENMHYKQWRYQR
jgi:hypothetical protein